jgi:hypothetical protein
VAAAACALVATSATALTAPVSGPVVVATATAAAATVVVTVATAAGSVAALCTLANRLHLSCSCFTTVSYSPIVRASAAAFSSAPCLAAAAAAVATVAFVVAVASAAFKSATSVDVANAAALWATTAANAAADSPSRSNAIVNEVRCGAWRYCNHRSAGVDVRRSYWCDRTSVARSIVFSRSVIRCVFTVGVRLQKLKSCCRRRRRFDLLGAKTKHEVQIVGDSTKRHARLALRAVFRSVATARSPFCLCYEQPVRKGDLGFAESIEIRELTNTTTSTTPLT